MKLDELTKLYIYDGSYNDHHTPKYEEGMGYAIPHVKDPKTVTFIENLNLQTSRYHKETVMSHIALVVFNMTHNYDYDYDDIDELGIAIAILHDLGKKYTIKINNSGDICYYGHEKLSAEIARDVITNINNNIFTDDEVDILYNVIKHHLDLKLIKDQDKKETYCLDFTRKYGKRALKYLLMLDTADQGIADINDLHSKETLEKIQIGTNIIRKYVENW